MPAWCQRAKAAAATNLSRLGASRGSGAGAQPLATPSRVLEPLRLDQRRVAPGRRIGEERLEQLPIEVVAGAHAAEMAEDRAAGEVEIAQRIEQLVAHELVSIAEAALIEDGIAAHHHGILERAAARESRCAHPVDILKEAEGTGAGDLALEALA